jgi:hypothetical protein
MTSSNLFHGVETQQNKDNPLYCIRRKLKLRTLRNLTLGICTFMTLSPGILRVKERVVVVVEGCRVITPDLRQRSGAALVDAPVPDRLHSLDYCTQIQTHAYFLTQRNAQKNHFK